MDLARNEPDMIGAEQPGREKKARRLRKLLIFAALCGVVYWMLDAFARQALYPAPAVPVPSPPPAPLEEVRLSLATGEQAVAWALERHPGRPVIVCGWSLGAALSLATAARRPGEVQGVAVLSPWTSLADVARHHFPPFLVSALLREKYDSLAAARQVTVPALVIHGEVDDLIPTEQGRRVAEALAGPAALADAVRWVPVPGAGHNDLLAQPVVWEELARFFSRFG